MNPYRSIRWQLLIWQMLLLAAVLTTLLSLHYHLQRKSLIAEADAALQNALMVVMPMATLPAGKPPVGRPPSHHPPRVSPDPTLLEDVFPEEIEHEDIYVAAWNETGMVAYEHGTVPANIAAADFASYRGDQSFVSRAGNRELIVYHPTGTVILVGKPLAEIDARLSKTRNQSLLMGSGVFLLGLAGGRLIIRKALRPIQAISKTAEEIAGGDHSRRIELSDAPEELAGLAHTLNTSFNHLDNALETQKRFSADASHELRTPIAVVIAQAQAALKRDRSAEEYKTVLEACLRAGQRMKAMADSLLELTRISDKETALNQERLLLNQVVADAVHEASHLSDTHPVDFKNTADPVEMEFDRENMHQILMNLLTNAIRHNPGGCAVHVSLESMENAAVIRIADDGMGIPGDALPHVFERFYRVDKSRSREQGGTGLGLSIVKSLVEAHRGTIAVSSEPSKQTVFTVTLPLASSGSAS